MRSKLAIAFLIVGLLFVAAWRGQGHTAKVESVSYEYLVLPDPTETSESTQGLKKLNELGAEGWELAGVSKTGGYGSARLYFKRARKSL
jgi:hypothetical protein